jgi:hypothetical protein
MGFSYRNSEMDAYGVRGFGSSYRNSEMRQKFHFVSTFALRVMPGGVIPAFEPESRLKSEMDAYGVIGIAR